MASTADAPRSYIASPDVYKVIAENNDTRVILATWKPDKRDEWHSHPPGAAVYVLTDCEALRLYSPDGHHLDGSLKAVQRYIQLSIRIRLKIAPAWSAG
jgi:hypothetical protein